MKNCTIKLAFFLTMLSAVYLSFQADAQDKARKSPKASVTQGVGADTDITITYSRPAVNGRKVWGELVPYGMNPGNQYSKNKPYPWRAGANENTTIEFTTDVLIEGRKLAAGKYGLHMIPSAKEWTIIFSKNNSAWGSYSYNQEEDALRVTVKPVQAEHKEWLTYSFEDLSENSATVFLHWEKLKVPFKVQSANKT